MAIFFSLSKNDDRSLDFICRHARFYLDHKCEINSKRLDPPRSPQGYSLPKRTQGGGPAPWILSHSNFRSGTLILSLEGWAHWILFSSYLRFGTYLIFSKVQPLDFSSNLLWLQFQQDLGAPALRCRIYVLVFWVNLKIGPQILAAHLLDFIVALCVR